MNKWSSNQMKELFVLFMKSFFVFYITQLISGSGVTGKTVFYSLFGAAIWVLLLKIFPNLTNRE